MDRTRRDVLAAAASLAALAGCAGGEDATATDSPTENTPTPTATAAPTEPPTETPTPAPKDSLVRLWPQAVTAVFAGEVSYDAIEDALEAAPSTAQVYHRDRADGTVTYYVSAAASFYVADATEAFEDADGLELRRVYRGVGPRYRRQYESTLRAQAAEAAGVEPSSVTVTPGRFGSHQFFDVSAPAGLPATVPMLPELSLRRADDSEQLVGPAGVALDAGFLLMRSRTRDGVVSLKFTLDDAGAEAFSDAETAALSTFVDTGGAVFLHDQSDYSDYDQTAYLNDLAASVGVDFRFNDDQVYDETNNAGSNFLPTTAKFNIASFESLFANRPGIDEATALDPSQTYTVDVVDVADGDTIDVQFDDDRVDWRERELAQS